MRLFYVLQKQRVKLSASRTGRQIDWTIGKYVRLANHYKKNNCRFAGLVHRISQACFQKHRSKRTTPGHVEEISQQACAGSGYFFCHRGPDRLRYGKTSYPKHSPELATFPAERDPGHNRLFCVHAVQYGHKSPGIIHLHRCTCPRTCS